jgi:hypothetical protein
VAAGCVWGGFARQRRHYVRSGRVLQTGECRHGFLSADRKLSSRKGAGLGARLFSGTESFLPFPARAQRSGARARARARNRCPLESDIRSGDATEFHRPSGQHRDNRLQLGMTRLDPASDPLQRMDWAVRSHRATRNDSAGYSDCQAIPVESIVSKIVSRIGTASRLRARAPPPAAEHEHERPRPEQPADHWPKLRATTPELAACSARIRARSDGAGKQFVAAGGFG